MKPWPVLLTRLYPLAAGVLTERPWWVHDEGGWYKRSDNQLDREMRTHNIDRLTPLPFPGLRVMQTWAVNVTTASAAVFTITEYDTGHEEDIDIRLFNPTTDRRVVIRAGGTGPVIDVVVLRARPWHAGGAWITDAELLALCQAGYLLADVVCPHLAPWAGVARPCETCEGTGVPKPGNAGKPGKDGEHVCIICDGTGVRA